jgi:glycosyltransferase involved in cell wall biosynthesis
MHIFVASWFFPPNTSSEGIVAYKLLSNSANTYDVCSAESQLWTYKQRFLPNVSNIKVFPVATNDFDTWIEAAIDLFEKQHSESPYDAIMTRSMPPESILFAQRLRERHPEIPWIASLADPIAKNPYQILGWVLESEELSEQEKQDFQLALRTGCDNWRDRDVEGIPRMCELKHIEDYALRTADILIFPDETLKTYLLDSRIHPHVMITPHSFDRSFYPDVTQTANLDLDNRITLTFIGHSDVVRSLNPLVEALNLLRQTDSRALEKLRLRFVGNIPDDTRTLVFNYYLHNIISIEESVDYQTSLRIMMESDWLIHIDAYFEFLATTGGSIFFAGKLADYMGTDCPILALTGRGSPAERIVAKAGGISLEQKDHIGIAQALAAISEGKKSPIVSRSYRDLYNAVGVAQQFDVQLDRFLNKRLPGFTRSYWPQTTQIATAAEKLISICVPAYNVEPYLDRCLFSLVASSASNDLEVIVVNDGSSDGTAAIAAAYQEHYPDIIKLINKANGGHGSTINVALQAATGVYFRVLDGDDWLDSQSLAQMVLNIREKGLTPDLVSTNYQQVYIDDGHTVAWMKISDSDNYRIYDFADSDFSMEYFTMASTMIRTELLRSAEFTLQEHTYYVDVEFILFPVPLVKTVMFTPEYVYRYAVGNSEQSINPEVFTLRYEHHDRVIRRMLDYYATKKPLMGKGQIKYVDSLFVRHLLKSHYLLSLIWDPKNERGAARAKDFDHYLKGNNPEFYRQCGKRYKAVARARARGFNPKSVARLHATDMEEHSLKQSFKNYLWKKANRYRHTSLGRRLANNDRVKALVRRLIS